MNGLTLSEENIHYITTLVFSKNKTITIYHLLGSNYTCEDHQIFKSRILQNKTISEIILTIINIDIPTHIKNKIIIYLEEKQKSFINILIKRVDELEKIVYLLNDKMNILEDVSALNYH